MNSTERPSWYFEYHDGRFFSIKLRKNGFGVTLGVTFGVTFYSVFFRFRPYKLPFFKRKKAIFAFFEGQNYMLERFRGTLFGVKF